MEQGLPPWIRYGDGLIYTSTNSGQTWTPTLAPFNQWTCVACSSNGMQIVAANSGIGDCLVYSSPDGGLTWNATEAPTNQWEAICSSADGTQLVAADSGDGDGLIYASTNSGTTWEPTTAPVGDWTSVAASSDGSRVMAAASTGGIYTWASPPVLSITPSNRNISISWQALSSTTGFVLQNNSDLTTTNWAAVTNLPVLTNGFYRAAIPMTGGGNLFYRLVNP